MEYEIIPNGVCSMKIKVVIEDGIIKDVIFIGGCSGNTKGLAALLKGMTPEEAIKRLKGIDCRGRGTSCPDQLACGLEKILENKTHES